jgi:hypothetical protein
MVLENKRLDITDRVTAKFGNDDQMDLFVENKQIGRMSYSSEGKKFELNPGFESEQSRIYQYTDVTTDPDQKYVDCDEENGWC